MKMILKFIELIFFLSFFALWKWICGLHGNLWIFWNVNWKMTVCACIVRCVCMWVSDIETMCAHTYKHTAVCRTITTIPFKTCKHIFCYNFDEKIFGIYFSLDKIGYCSITITNNILCVYIIFFLFVCLFI